MANNLTGNLNTWIAKLKSLRSSVYPTALMNVLPKETRRLQDILWRNVEQAISINTEFDYPIFKTGLRKAVYDDRTIVVTILPRGIQSGIHVRINFDVTAGNIEDYANAVSSVRDTTAGSTTRRQASAYWRNFVYGQAREGFTIKQKRKPGKPPYHAFSRCTVGRQRCKLEESSGTRSALERRAHP